MYKLFFIGLGGFIGAISRYGVSELTSNLFHTNFPIGTLSANVTGCFLIGLLMYFVEVHSSLSPQLRSFVITGILGALTTFSTFGFDTLELYRDTGWPLASLNIGSNVILGLIAVVSGRFLLQLF